MKTQTRWLQVLALLLVVTRTHAQLVADGATATINVATNLTGDVIVGTNGAFTTLIITNSGAVTNSGNGVISQNTSALTNHVLVTGGNSIWSMTGNLNLGAQGDYGRLTVTNGGRVYNNFGNMALNNTSVGNVAIVTGANSLWTNRGALNIGNSGLFNQLFVSNGAVVGVFGKATVGNASASSNLLWVSSGGTVFSDSGTLGLNGVVRGNVAVIKDAGTRWTMKSVLEVGPFGQFNQLYITNGAEVFSAGAYVGANIINSSDGQTNLAVLSGAGSAWTNTAAAAIGGFGSFNQLIISNGATMRHSGFGSLTVGVQPGSTNNSMLVSGAGALFSSRGGTSQLFVGGSGAFNKLSVLQGGTVETDNGIIGNSVNGTNNLAVIANAGSTWNSAASFYVGQAGAFNELVVSNGGTLQTAMFILGFSASSSNNVATVQGGSVIVTNSGGGGATDVRRGTLTLSSGLLLTDTLRATNGSESSLSFASGTIRTRNTTVANNQVFQVGGGGGNATFELLASGAHNFADGLRLASGSVLKGNGTIVGNVTNLSGGVISPGASIGKLILSYSPSLQGTVFMELSKNGANLTNDQVQVLSTLTYAGTLTVTNLGPDALALGDQFQLFDAPAFAGGFTNLNLPGLPAGLVWTNKLLVDGSIEVVTVPVPVFESATRSGTNVIFSGINGTAGQNYAVLTATNVTTQLSNWISLRTNQFSAGGVFTFTNPIAPGEPQRYFRIRTP